MSEDFDRRMRELADRVVAMSPEPPPFPEETVVIQPNGESKPRPVLMFAGAALAVLLLVGIPILLFTGDEGEPAVTTTPTTLPSTVVTEPAPSTTEPAPTTTVPETTTSTGPVLERRQVVAFLVGEAENSFTGNPAVVPFLSISEALPEESDEMAALRLLTRDDLILPEGFSNVIPAPVEVIGVELYPEDHWVVVDMNQAFLEGAGGALADFTMLNQLIFTVTASEFGGFTEVLFTVEGEPITQFGSEGLDLSEPVGRDSFLDQLNSVIVVSAAAVTGDGPLVVSGIANVFEATVSLDLVDADGNVVYEDFTTATCGTGCWGSYFFNIDFDFESTPVTMRVFWNSAENGEPVDVVSMPVGVGDHAVWDMLPVD